MCYMEPIVGQRLAGQVPLRLPAQLEERCCLHAEISVPHGEGPLRFSERYSRRQWLSDTRSIQVVLFQLRVTI